MAKNQNAYEQFMNVDYASLSDWIFSFSGYEYAVVGSLIGIIIASPLNLNQQNSIGNFFELIGQTILTINAQEINRRSGNTPNNIGNQQDTYYRINNLEQEIRRLREELNNLKK